MEHEELTGKVIKAAINVHRALGPGFLESIYESAICLELEELRIPFDRQVIIPIIFKGKQIGEHRADLIVQQKIIVELKTVTGIEEIHFSVVRSYLKAAGLKHALLLNFASMPLTVKRVLYNPNRYGDGGASCLPDFLIKESPSAYAPTRS